MQRMGEEKELMDQAAHARFEGRADPYFIDGAKTSPLPPPTKPEVGMLSGLCSDVPHPHQGV